MADVRLALRALSLSLFMTGYAAASDDPVEDIVAVFRKDPPQTSGLQAAQDEYLDEDDED